MVGSPDSDLMMLDRLGVRPVADAMGLSCEAVRRWRSRGAVPDQRKNELRRLYTNMVQNVDQSGSKPDQANTFGVGNDSEPRLPMVVPRQVSATDDLVDLRRIDGKTAVSEAEMAIAERRAIITGRALKAATRRAMDGPIGSNRYWYPLKLLVLFLLEFPVLTMAFVPVAQVSPVVAACSAAALALFLILGAHALGHPLRSIGDRLSASWRAVIGAVTIGFLIVGIVAIILDLRIKGLELDGATLQLRNNLVFGNTPVFSSPDDVVATLSVAAAFVTIGGTFFGIIWSYHHHSPRNDHAKAEDAYRRSLLKLAKFRARKARRNRMTIAGAIALPFLILVSSPEEGHASSCPGDTIAVLLDATTVYDETDRHLIMLALENMAAQLRAGQRLVVHTVSDDPQSSYVLFDDCLPGDQDLSWSATGIWTWLTSGPNQTSSEKKAFYEDLRASVLPRLYGDLASKKTALVGTLVDVAATTDGLSVIWLLTDLLETAVVDAEILLNGPQDALFQASHQRPKLQDIHVNVAGIGRFHDRDRRDLTSKERMALTSAWRYFINACGGRFQVFDIVDE